MGESIMNAFLSVAMKIQSQRHISAIKNGFTTLLPIIIVGSFCTLFSSVVCSTTPGYLSLANIPGLSFLHALDPMFTAANYGSMSMLAIGACILISMELSQNMLGKADWSVPVTAIACYISLVANVIPWSATAASGEVLEGTVSGLAASVTNAQGLFVAMLSALVSTEIYCRLVLSGKLEIHMPDSVPSNVAGSFSILFPCCLTVFIVSGFGLLFTSVTGMTVPAAIIRFIQTPLAGVMGSWQGYCILILMTNILWLFGIHGSQTLKGIYEPFMLAAFAENEAAYAAGLSEIPTIINTPFMSCFGTITGAGVTGGLLIAIMLFSKREDYRAIAKLAIPCGIFNINEPLTFGLPIVMNPLLAIPFCLAPLASNLIGYFATAAGFCGRMVVNAPWTTPPVLMAFLSSGGSVGAAITQLVVILVAAVIYTPFVIAANSQAPAEED
ncbi:MAG: PTS transporter subunit EIIC [Clostridiales bacterium]|nr:PTS transporter subunit EIIC [Clostridiales bacterium]